MDSASVLAGFVLGFFTAIPLFAAVLLPSIRRDAIEEAKETPEEKEPHLNGPAPKKPGTSSGILCRRERTLFDL